MNYLRYASIALILLVGGIHLQQWDGTLHEVPTISTLFILNAIGAAAIALVLAGSDGRLSIAAALAGIGLSIGSLVSLAISRQGTLFDYSEPTLRDAVAFATVVEVAAVITLAAFILGSLRSRDGVPASP